MTQQHNQIPVIKAALKVLDRYHVGGGDFKIASRLCSYLDAAEASGVEKYARIIANETARLNASIPDEHCVTETPSYQPSEQQLRLARALGLREEGNIAFTIEAALNGRMAVDAVYEYLMTEMTPTNRVKRNGEVEHIPAYCPFCNATNDGYGGTNKGYSPFSFNTAGGYCFSSSCRQGGGLIDIALAYNGHWKSSGSPAKEPKKREKVKKSTAVPLAKYLRFNQRAWDMSEADYLSVVDYFASHKRLDENFVRVYVLPYLDKFHIRFNQVKYSYQTGERGLALNVPMVNGNLVTSIKRRLVDMKKLQHAPRWNFNLYPNDESQIWTTITTPSDYVVVVENQLDSAILNLMSELEGMTSHITFCAPVCPKMFDVTSGMAHLKGTSVIVPAYDLDATGDEYFNRDLDALRENGFTVATLDYFDDWSRENDSPLDWIIRRGWGMRELFHFMTGN